MLFTSKFSASAATVLALLVSPSIAWQVTFYSSSPCNDVDGNFDYWYYEGTGVSPCIEVGTVADGVSCFHYLNGGASNVPCEGNAVSSESFYIHSGSCSLSTVNGQCATPYGSDEQDCQTISNKSFKCWS